MFILKEVYLEVMQLKLLDMALIRVNIGLVRILGDQIGEIMDTLKLL